MLDHIKVLMTFSPGQGVFCQQQVLMIGDNHIPQVVQALIVLTEVC